MSYLPMHLREKTRISNSAERLPGPEHGPRLFVRSTLNISGRLIFALISFCLGLDAQAYHTGEHAQITLQAVREINACSPGLISDEASAVMVNANLDEDYNIFRKDIWYSHYFNPFKKLKMRRYDSSVRVDRLRSRLEQVKTHSTDQLDVFDQLGHLVHHLQDVTVPPHVVPVTHALYDGFESFPVKNAIGSGVGCTMLKQWETFEPVDFNGLLRETASATLQNIAKIHLEVPASAALVNFSSFIVDGSAFWVEGQVDSFGAYGYLGNAFGTTSVWKDGTHYTIPEQFYRDFKQNQMRLAVFATLRALLGEIMSEQKNSTPPMPVFARNGPSHPSRDLATKSFLPRTNFIQEDED